MLNNIAGFRMIESVHAQEEDGKMGRYVKRTMKERLFSLPWRPFRKDKLIIATRYKPIMFRIQDRIVYHPSLRSGIEALTKSAVS